MFWPNFLTPIYWEVYDFMSTFGQGFRILVISKHGCPLSSSCYLPFFPSFLLYPPFLLLSPIYLLPLFTSRPRLSCFDAMSSPPPPPAHRPPSRHNREANFRRFSAMKFQETLATKCQSLGQIKAKVRYFCPGYLFITHFLTGISSQTFIRDLSDLMSTFIPKHACPTHLNQFMWTIPACR